MPNYSDGKIYKLVDNTTDEVYIGSTTQPLYKRKGGHEGQYKYYLKGKTNYVTSFKIVKNGDYRIVLIENYPCLDKSQLHEKERHWIQSIECVNKVIPNRTDKEYREENKGKIKEYKKQYYENNKESIKQNVAHFRNNNKEVIKQRNKQFREANKESIKQSNAQYREANKDTMKAKRALNYKCECSAVITHGEKSRHMKSIKHQNYLKSLETPAQ